MIATLVLLARLQCAAWAGSDFDCQAQWLEDRCNAIEAETVQWCIVHCPDQSEAGVSDCIEARLPEVCQ